MTIFRVMENFQNHKRRGILPLLSYNQPQTIWEIIKEKKRNDYHLPSN